ncbi:transposase family protein [Streptomyces mirabilis]
MGLEGGECDAGQGRWDGRPVGVRGDKRGPRPGLPCGIFSTRLKDYRTTRPRHLSCGGRPVSIQWRKARWYCTEPACPRGSFTEAIGQVPSRMRTTKPLRQRRRGPRSVTAGARWCRPAGIWACPGRSCSAASRTTQ